MRFVRWLWLATALRIVPGSDAMTLSLKPFNIVARLFWRRMREWGLVELRRRVRGKKYIVRLYLRWGDEPGTAYVDWVHGTQAVDIARVAL